MSENNKEATNGASNIDEIVFKADEKNKVIEAKKIAKIKISEEPSKDANELLGDYIEIKAYDTILEKEQDNDTLIME